MEVDAIRSKRLFYVPGGKANNFGAAIFRNVFAFLCGWTVLCQSELIYAVTYSVAGYLVLELTQKKN